MGLVARFEIVTERFLLQLLLFEDVAVPNTVVDFDQALVVSAGLPNTAADFDQALVKSAGLPNAVVVNDSAIVESAGLPNTVVVNDLAFVKSAGLPNTAADYDQGLVESAGQLMERVVAMLRGELALAVAAVIKNCCSVWVLVPILCSG